MARKKGDHAKRRQEVARATLLVVARRGPERTSLMDIAAELGCTTGALRHYFRTKAQLLGFAKDTLFNEVKDRMMASKQGQVGLNRLRAMVAENLPLDKERLLVWRIYLAFLGHAVGSASMVRLQHRRETEDLRLLRDEIAELQQQGYARADIDADAEAFALKCLLEGIGMNIAVSPTLTPAQEQMAIIDRYLQRVFSPEGGSVSSSRKAAPRPGIGRADRRHSH